MKNYSWKDFDKDVSNLVRRIKYAKFTPNTIVALARGGLPMGVKLSHLMKAPLMIISVKSYNEKKNQTNTVLLNSSYTVPLKSPVLIVDEVSDSGHTLQLVKDHFESLGVEVRTSTLVYKEKSCIKPDWYMRKVTNDTWVTFPWE